MPHGRAARSGDFLKILEKIVGQGVPPINVTNTGIPVTMPAIPETGVYRIERKRPLYWHRRAQNDRPYQLAGSPMQMGSHIKLTARRTLDRVYFFMPFQRALRAERLLRNAVQLVPIPVSHRDLMLATSAGKPFSAPRWTHFRERNRHSHH